MTPDFSKDAIGLTNRFGQFGGDKLILDKVVIIDELEALDEFRDHLLSAIGQHAESAPTIAPVDLSPPQLELAKRCVASGKWFHGPIDNPPQEYKEGTLEGTRNELSSWLRPEADYKELRRRVENGSVWVRRHSRTHWEAFFREKALYEFAKANSLTQPPNSTK